MRSLKLLTIAFILFVLPASKAYANNNGVDKNDRRIIEVEEDKVVLQAGDQIIPLDKEETSGEELDCSLKIHDDFEEPQT